MPVGAVIAVVGDGAAAPAPAPAAPAAPAVRGRAGAEAPAPTAARAGPPPSTGVTCARRPAPAAGSRAGPSPQPSRPPPPAPPPAPRHAAPAPAPRSADGDDARLLSPVVRRLVAEHGLDPSDITGTGPGGRITRDDVLDHIDRVGSRSPAAAPRPPRLPAPAPAAAAPAAPGGSPGSARRRPARRTGGGRRRRPSPGERDSSVRLSKIRKLTGAHMVGSLATSPHAFSVVEVDFANVDVTRGKVKSAWKAARGLQPHVPAVHHPRRRRRARRVPAPQRLASAPTT